MMRNGSSPAPARFSCRALMLRARTSAVLIPPAPRSSTRVRSCDSQLELNHPPTRTDSVTRGRPRKIWEGRMTRSTQTGKRLMFGNRSPPLRLRCPARLNTPKLTKCLKIVESTLIPSWTSKLRFRASHSCFGSRGILNGTGFIPL